MAGTHTPGLGKADQNKLSSNAVSFGRCLLSTYSVPVSLRYTSLMLFHFSVQPTPRSGYHYLSLTNEQVGRPGRLNGFPKAKRSCRGRGLNPNSSLRWVLYYDALSRVWLMYGSHHVWHKAHSVLHPHPQVAHKSMSKVHKYMTVESD